MEVVGNVLLLFSRSQKFGAHVGGGGGGGGGGGTNWGYRVIGTPYLLLLIFSSSLSSLIFAILHSNLEAKEAPKKPNPRRKKKREKDGKIAKFFLYHDSWSRKSLKP